MKKVARLS